MRRPVWILAAVFAAAATGIAAPAGKDISFGYWAEPGGSIIRVEDCGSDVCARLVGLSRGVSSTMDDENPDPALKTRPLCGLLIGIGFHLESPGTLEGGKLYDPKSGKTYSGSIRAEGDKLKLRGYVGAKIFGRSETWTRVGAPTACAK